jgi:hypothetical protein
LNGAELAAGKDAAGLKKVIAAIRRNNQTSAKAYWINGNTVLSIA